MTATRPKLNAASFDLLLDQARACARSLASCIAAEVPAEALRLRNAVSDLCAAELARKSGRLIEARRAAINLASDILARRQA